jgi:hypothetical protein
MKRMKYCAAIFIFLSLISPSSFAWGPEGHRIVADIAGTRLTSTARLHVKELLGNDDLATVSVWADEMKGERPETYGWHFVDIPNDTNGFSEARDCYRPVRSVRTPSKTTTTAWSTESQYSSRCWPTGMRPSRTASRR